MLINDSFDLVILMIVHILFYFLCRHWQDLGYLILYITGRPDMQQRRVMSWLSQHNFPLGLVYFADGISTDPLRHKGEYLRRLQTEVRLMLFNSKALVHSYLKKLRLVGGGFLFHSVFPVLFFYTLVILNIVFLFICECFFFCYSF